MSMVLAGPEVQEAETGVGDGFLLRYRRGRRGPMLLFSPGAPKNEMDPGVLARMNIPSKGNV